MSAAAMRRREFITLLGGAAAPRALGLASGDKPAALYLPVVGDVLPRFAFRREMTAT
jgi:hypothetical protein